MHEAVDQSAAEAQRRLRASLTKKRSIGDQRRLRAALTKKRSSGGEAAALLLGFPVGQWVREDVMGRGP